MIKINRAKLVPKLILAILVFTTITGFACTFVTAKENQRSTKLAFNATETMIWPVGWVPMGDPWGDGKFLQQIYYKEASLDGTIENYGSFSGYDELYLHVRMDPTTGDVISIGKVTMHISCDNGPQGTFYGSVIAKGNQLDGTVEGKYTMQGAGGFEGMKLFGRLSPLPVVVIDEIVYIRNELEGTILDPNNPNQE